MERKMADIMTPDEGFVLGSNHRDCPTIVIAKNNPLSKYA